MPRIVDLRAKKSDEQMLRHCKEVRFNCKQKAVVVNRLLNKSGRYGGGSYTTGWRLN